MTRPPGLHDPDVDNDHWAEIVDAHHDHYPTRAECAEVDEWPTPKRVAEPCADCDHLLCALQRRVQGWVA